MTLPPWAEVADKWQTLFLPALAGGALGVVLLLALSRRLAWPAAALGALGGVAFVNAGQQVFPWCLGTRTYEGIAPAAITLTLVGLITQPILYIPWRPQITALTAWLIRVGAAVVVCGWPTPDWPDRLALAGLVSLQWAVLDLTARPIPGRGRNRSAHIVMLHSLTLMLAGIITLYAHSLRLTDLLSVSGAALFGVAIAGFATGADVRAAIPLGSLVLPATLSVARATTTSQVPDAAFIMAAVAPLGLVPWVFPPLARRDGLAGILLRFAVVIALTGVAVALAGRVESLPWEAE